jgi:hypothetical protein
MVERAEFDRFADTTTHTLERIEAKVDAMSNGVSTAHQTLGAHDARLRSLEKPDIENKAVTRGQLRIVMLSGGVLIAVLKFLKVL